MVFTSLNPMARVDTVRDMGNLASCRRWGAGAPCLAVVLLACVSIAACGRRPGGQERRSPSLVETPVPADDGCAAFLSSFTTLALSRPSAPNAEPTHRAVNALALLSESSCPPPSIRRAAVAAVQHAPDEQLLQSSCGPVRVGADIVDFSERCQLPGEPALDMFAIQSGSIGGLLLTIPEYVVARELALWLQGLDASLIAPEQARAVASAMVEALVAEARHRVRPARVTELLTEADAQGRRCTSGDAHACHRLGMFLEFLRGVGANDYARSVTERRIACRWVIEGNIRGTYGSGRRTAEGALASCQSDPAHCQGDVTLWETMIRDGTELERRAISQLHASEAGAECLALGDQGRTFVSEECSWICAE